MNVHAARSTASQIEMASHDASELVDCGYGATPIALSFLMEANLRSRSGQECASPFHWHRFIHASTIKETPLEIERGVRNQHM
jgi:hypothetical protein